MRNYTPTHRYSISSNQLNILSLLWKYRFVSSDVVAGCLAKDRSTIYERLQVLVDQQYVIKLYDSTYRLRHRPAIYYLAPLGIRYLKQAGYERTQLHYKNKRFSDEQIDEQLLLGRLARTIYKSYRSSHILRTKYQLGADAFYLSPPLYARLLSRSGTTPGYFIEYFPPYYESWKIYKRIRAYIEYVDERDDYLHPHLLLICGNQNTEKRVTSMKMYIFSNFEVFTATEERVLSGKKTIWLRPYEVDWDNREGLEFHSLPLVYGSHQLARLAPRRP